MINISLEESCESQGDRIEKDQDSNKPLCEYYQDKKCGTWFRVWSGKYCENSDYTGNFSGCPALQKVKNLKSNPYSKSL